MARGGVPVSNQLDAKLAPGSVQPLTPLRISTSPDAFGAAEARAGQQVAGGLQQAGNAALSIGLQMQQQENENTAQQLDTQFARNLNDQWQAFSQKRGANLTQQDLADFRQGLTDAQTTQMEGQNRGVQQMLRQRTDARITSMLSSAGTFYQEQVRVAGVQASTGAQQQAVNDAILHQQDPTMLSASIGNGLEALTRQAQLEGWAPEFLAAKQTAFRSDAISAVVRDQVNRDPMQAQATFNRYRDQLDAQHIVGLQDALEAPVRRVQSNAEADRIINNGTAAAADSDSVRDRVFRAENPAGDARRNAAGSSASGPGQITDATFNTYAAKLGIPASERNTRETANKIWDAYQADARQAMGRPLSGGEQYAAWGLGVSAMKAMSADPSGDAYATYSQVAGPGIADKAFSQNGRLMRRGMTNQQVIDAWASRVGGPAAKPDRSAMIGQAAQIADPQLRAATLSVMTQRFSVQDAANAQEKAALEDRLRSLGQAFTAGQPDVEIPRQQIRALYEPAQADAMIDNLEVQQLGAQIGRSVAQADPATINNMLTDLRDGKGVLTDMVRQRRGIVAGTDGQVAEQDRAGDEAARASLLKLVQDRVAVRNEALQRDPALYAQSDPTVQTAMHAMQANPNDPAAVQTYMTALRAAQTRLGVSEDNQRVLPQAQSQQIVSQITHADPAKVDMGQQIAAFEKQYGAQWPAVWNDLIRDGKLPVQYRPLGIIGNPVARTDMANALRIAAEPGGLNGWERTQDPKAMKDTEDAVRSVTRPFLQTAQGSAGAITMAGQTQQSIELLSKYYVSRGLDPASAAQTAYDRIITDRYDVVGSYRAPHGQGGRVAQSLYQVAAAIKPEDIAQQMGNEQLTQAQRQDIAVHAAQRGVWVNNRTDDGVILTIPLRGGDASTAQPLRRADGSFFEVKFNNLPEPDYHALQPSNMGLTPDLGDAFRPGATTGSGQTAPTAAPATAAPAQQAATPSLSPVPNQPQPGQRGAPRRTGRWVAPN